MKQRQILPRITKEEALKIKSAMNRKGLSQKKFSEKVCLNQGLVSNILTSLKAMTSKRAELFYNGLEKDPELDFLKDYIMGNRQPDGSKEENLNEIYRGYVLSLRGIFSRLQIEDKIKLLGDLENLAEKYKPKE